MLYISMKTGQRPILHSLDQSMLKRIGMDVIYMCGEVGLVAYQVLPEPALPNVSLPLTVEHQWDSNAFQPSEEKRFDAADPRRKIGITVRQSHQQMEMLGQYHRCGQLEWPLANCLSQ